MYFKKRAQTLLVDSWNFIVKNWWLVCCGVFECLVVMFFSHIHFMVDVATAEKTTGSFWLDLNLLLRHQASEGQVLVLASTLIAPVIYWTVFRDKRKPAMLAHLGILVVFFASAILYGNGGEGFKFGNIEVAGYDLYIYSIWLWVFIILMIRIPMVTGTPSASKEAKKINQYLENV